MTDAQLITISAAFLAAVIAVLFNNSRIGDLRTTVDKRLDDMNRTVDKRLDDMNRTMDKRFDDVNRHIDDKFTLLSQQMKHMEENIVRVLGEHETRIARLENKG